MAPTTTDGFGIAKGSGVCSSLGNRTRNLILGALLGILVVMIGGGAIFPSNSSNANPNHHKASIRANHYDYGTSSSSASTSSSSSSSASSSASFETKPSFQISPIDDMGMLSVQRNDDALPSSVWGNHLHQEGHPLPTNSWYLVRCVPLFTLFTICLVIDFCSVPPLWKLFLTRISLFIFHALVLNKNHLTTLIDSIAITHITNIQNKTNQNATTQQIQSKTTVDRYLDVAF